MSFTSSGEGGSGALVGIGGSEEGTTEFSKEVWVEIVTVGVSGTPIVVVGVFTVEAVVKVGDIDDEGASDDVVVVVDVLVKVKTVKVVKGGTVVVDVVVGNVGCVVVVVDNVCELDVGISVVVGSLVGVSLLVVVVFIHEPMVLNAEGGTV